MPLITSISGIRGTIGGKPGGALTPLDIVKFVSAYSTQLKNKFPNKKSYKVLVGRDARVSGVMVDQLVCGTLISLGVDVINVELASTPTVEMAVVFEKADGGVIITASHNPGEWNALKLLNEKGEFIDADEGQALLELARKSDFSYSSAYDLGSIKKVDYTKQHIEAILSYPLIDIESVYRAGFTVVLDATNSVGGIIIPQLLDALGVNYICINCEPTGIFKHNPEPLPENLVELSSKVKEHNADLGISVDPDVDRLALISETGEPFGEEYTLVAAADYLLTKKRGAVVSNLSSSRALRDIAKKYGCDYYASAVGEVNVVQEMKRVGAVIGGEGNGGIILPDLHYGRDALIGIALILSHLAIKKCKLSQLKEEYPQYHISKNKIELNTQHNIDKIFEEVINRYQSHNITTIDGVKIDFESDMSWIHLRQSNTEPIIRVYTESVTHERASALADDIISFIKQLTD